MLALTVRQPVASLIALGAVRYDVRTWRPPAWALGKLVAIHAGTDPVLLRAMLHQAPPIAAALAACGRAEGLTGPGSSARFPRGVVLATARLVAVHDATAIADQVSAAERAAGDWLDGRFAWEFAYVRPVDPPAPALGQRQLWSWKAPARVVGVA
ncbi:MAG: hypothetical protein AB7F67_03950 [Rhodospirillaceae bacterium]